MSANVSLNSSDQDTALSYFGSYVKADNYYAGGTFKEAGLAAPDRGYLDGDEVGSSAYKNQNHQLSISKAIDNEIYQSSQPIMTALMRILITKEWIRWATKTTNLI